MKPICSCRVQDGGKRRIDVAAQHRAEFACRSPLLPNRLWCSWSREKKAQPCGVALKFHQRRRIWRSVPKPWEGVDTIPLCITQECRASPFCCFAVEIFLHQGQTKLRRRPACCRLGQRTTRTGTFECVRTLRVSLPSSTAARPLRPCDVIRTKSQP